MCSPTFRCANKKHMFDFVFYGNSRFYGISFECRLVEGYTCWVVLGRNQTDTYNFEDSISHVETNWFFEA